MSKAVRLKQYLYDELEGIAARENRSLTNLVNHLLEQAITIEGRAAREEKAMSQTEKPAGVSERGGAGPDPGAVMEKDDRRNTDEGRAALASRSLHVPRSESPEDHFKGPDFKPEGKKKR